MTSRDTVRRSIRRHMIDGSQCDRVMNALEPVLAGQEHRLQVAFTKGFEQAKRAQRATDAARIRELKAEVARLRALQAHATSPECAPDLSQVISRFERTHVLWPQLPDVRITPIPGPIRRYIHLMTPAITRAALKQARAQLAQTQEQTR
jgi:hypothetical protein